MAKGRATTAERLFGMEIEYGCAPRIRDAARPDHRLRGWADQFMAAARDRLPHLPSMEGGGIFLENGARLYVDCSHPEMTTPECSNPWDVVRYMQAGERMLATISEEMVRRDPALAEVMLFKTNVDHGGSGATWGCHTSFMHRGNPEKFPAQIIPHLVSRIVYSGAGGLEPAEDGRLRFTLSPRVQFLEHEISNNSTNGRGIFHTKDETLSADGYHRLHIICGESLCSETALWLSMGTTALVVALIDAGLRPGQGVRLLDSLDAMRRFSLDPTCRAVAPTLAGACLSAVQIQRHYLEAAEANRGAPFMPPWTDQVCLQWRKMLDRLENGAPGSVASTLDWAIKFSLFLDRAERRGLSSQHWHHAHAPTQSEPDGDDFHLTDEPEAAETPPSPEVVKVLQELCEIDTRFGQLGGKGIFAALDRAGVLEHRYAGVDNIEHALANPPAIGRARLRGQCVQRFAGQNRRYSCSWRHVVDREKHLLLDISDPFASEENWKRMPAAFIESTISTRADLQRTLLEARTSHDGGDHETAAQLLQMLRAYQNVFEPEMNAEYLRLQAWVQGRRGFPDGLQALDDLAQLQSMNLSLINNYVCFHRYQGLIPPPAIEPWIERGRKCLARKIVPSDGAALPFLDHWGYFLLRTGRPEEALRTLEDACHPLRRECSNPGAIARALADYGDARRALGQPAHAAAALEEAAQLQIENQLEGDRSDFALTYRAKLETNPVIALGLLGQAEAIQTRQGNLMGETRTLLLKARLLRDTAMTALLEAQLLEYRGQRPALAQCKLFAKILDHWDSWTTGGADPDGGTDFYWWL